MINHLFVNLSTFIFQSTNKCLHFVASGNTHVILGEAVRVKEKKLKVEEKKRKRKKSKKDPTQSSLIQSPTESSDASGQSTVQSSVQASPNSSSSNEMDNRISQSTPDHPQTGSNPFQNDPVSMRSDHEKNVKNSKHSNEKE